LTYKKLIEGFRLFKQDYFESGRSDFYQNLVEHGQKPDTLVIACSDSRIDPAILTNGDPGEFFAIRNVAALVPPYNCGENLQGTSSAIEYAVRFLNVKHIIVFGHAKCGGIEALASGNYQAPDQKKFQFMEPWLNIGLEAKQQVFKALDAEPLEEKIRALEQATIINSMANLLSFPWVKERCARQAIEIHGWYFDMASGELLEYNQNQQGFLNIDDDMNKTNLLESKPSLNAFIKNYAHKCGSGK
jgi:carbonic anhydrase